MQNDGKHTEKPSVNKKFFNITKKHLDKQRIGARQSRRKMWRQIGDAGVLQVGEGKKEAAGRYWEREGVRGKRGSWVQGRDGKGREGKGCWGNMKGRKGRKVEESWRGWPSLFILTGVEGDPAILLTPYSTPPPTPPGMLHQPLTTPVIRPFLVLSTCARLRRLRENRVLCYLGRIRSLSPAGHEVKTLKQHSSAEERGEGGWEWKGYGMRDQIGGEWRNGRGRGCSQQRW